MANNYAGNNSRNYPNAFLNNYVKWNSDVLSPSATHIPSPNGPQLASMMSRQNGGYVIHRTFCQKVMTTHIIYATNYICEYPL